MDLITSTEAAKIAGITPSTFKTLQHKPTTKTPIPPPVFQGKQGQSTLWNRSDIEAWAATRNTKRGPDKPPRQHPDKI